MPTKEAPFVIGIVGPESTGKSTLTKALANHYQVDFVHEIAREYLNQLGRDYQIDDLKKIASLQLEAENTHRKLPQKIILCDTTLLVIKIWSEYKYHQCDEWILKAEKENDYDLILLTDIDLPWIEDPLREHPHERATLFSIYYRSLIQKKQPFKIIFGNEKERFERAINAIESMKSMNKK
jgi:NadR type nicotinamide-nucleotide adenylyltransferase